MRNTTYKLVAIDVDGTLVNDEKKLTQKTIDAIKRVKNNTKIVISSARSFHRVKKYLEQLNLLQNNQYTIVFNGSVIIENKSEKVLLSDHFAEKEVNELIDLSIQLRIPIFLYSMDNVFVEKLPKIVEYSKNFEKVIFNKGKFSNIDFNSEKIYKILFVDEYRNISKIRKELPKEMFLKYSITGSIPECIEFVKKGSTKKKALKYICKKCNIEKEEIISIGDGDNDLEMISYAGLGVAMENATKLLKDNANYITASNNDDGVAKVLEKYIN